MNVLQYIIADKWQEENVFKRLEPLSARWITGELIYQFAPSESYDFKGFPYSIFLNTEDFTAFYTYDTTPNLDAII